MFPRAAVLLLAPIAVVGAAVLLEGRTGALTEAAPTNIDIQPSVLSGPMLGPADYPAMIEDAERRIALGEERVSKGQGEWLRAETLAAGLLARFDLAADYADLQGRSRYWPMRRRWRPRDRDPACEAHPLR